LTDDAGPDDRDAPRPDDAERRRPGEEEAGGGRLHLETWWALNRIEFFPHRYVSTVVSHEGPVARGAKPLSADVVRAASGSRCSR
jgi:hypothetical protein